MSLGFNPLGTTAIGGAESAQALPSISIVAAVPITASMSFGAPADITIAAVISTQASIDAVHGISAIVSVAIPVVASHNIAYGVALIGIASATTQAAASITVERYELRGEVRLGGVLVNRRVRAYLRSSGALLGESDTIVGTFSVHAGFAAAECYVTPIDMADGATDWLPPTANRIVGTLALDTA